MPNPLVVLAAQETARYQTATAAAQVALAAAQSAQAAGEASVSTLAADLAALDAKIAAVRASLAAIAMPADGNPLLDQLAGLLAQLHNKQGEILAAQQSLAAAKARAARVSAELARAQQQLGAATNAEAQITAQDEERNDWVAALGQPPLDTLRADATTALTTTPFTAAVTRVDTNVPAALRTRARERSSAQRARVKAARDYVTAAEDRQKQEHTDSDGPPGDALRKSVELDRAAAALRAYVATGRERYDRAVALAEGVLTAPALTTDQTSRVTDTALTTPGTAAATAEKARDDAAAAAAATQALYDDAVLAALVADPDADTTMDASVVAAQGNLTTALGDLATKQTAYTLAMRADLDKWEAALPDTMWRQVAAVEDARAILTDLSTLNPSTLTGALTAAETLLADALAEAAARRRAAALLQDTVTERTAAREAALSAQQDAALGAARGDS